MSPCSVGSDRGAVTPELSRIAVQHLTREESESSMMPAGRTPAIKTKNSQFSTQHTRAGKHENFILRAPKLVSGAFKRVHSGAVTKLFFVPEVLRGICSKELYYVAYEAHLEAKACEESRTDVGSRWGVFGSCGQRICGNQWASSGHSVAGHRTASRNHSR
jgi:hypothetical protein